MITSEEIQSPPSRGGQVHPTTCLFERPTWRPETAARHASVAQSGGRSSSLLRQRPALYVRLVRTCAVVVVAVAAAAAVSVPPLRNSSCRQM